MREPASTLRCRTEKLEDHSTKKKNDLPFDILKSFCSHILSSTVPEKNSQLLSRACIFDTSYSWHEKFDLCLLFDVERPVTFPDHGFRQPHDPFGSRTLAIVWPVRPRGFYSNNLFGSYRYYGSASLAGKYGCILNIACPFSCHIKFRYQL